LGTVSMELRRDGGIAAKERGMVPKEPTPSD
jgi:hypothetical protein